MTLPVSRDLTFAASSEVPSATLNALQDAVVAAHGSRDYQFGVAQADGILSAGDAALCIEFDRQVGERIIGVHVRGADDGVNRFSFKLYEMDMATGTRAELATATSTGATGAKDITVSSRTDPVTVAKRYFIVITMPASGNTYVYGGYVTVDRPTA